MFREYCSNWRLARQSKVPARRALVRAAVLLLVGCGGLTSVVEGAGEPGDYWLRIQGLQPWEWWVDHDGDGSPAIAEYASGTDPFDASSRLNADWVVHPDNGMQLEWMGVPGVVYRITRSVDLQTWSGPVSIVATEAGTLTQLVTVEAGQGYFRLETMLPGDADGDGLSAVEEEVWLRTDALKADTDGDGLPDGIEVFRTFTDPLVPNPQGATITGIVQSDPNGDGVLTDGVPLPGAEVYLDLDYDGRRGEAEPVQVTDAIGGYRFTHLRPGLYHVRQNLPSATMQTFPRTGGAPVLNRVPDEVIAYVHADTGALPVPYGREADPWKGVNTIVFPVPAQPVDPDLVTKPIGDRAQLPAIGVFSSTEFLALPDGASIVVRFDEQIVDGPGSDLQIVSFNSPGEPAEISLGASADTLVPVATIGQAAGATGLDLAAYGMTGPIQFVRLRSLSSQGSIPGFDLVGFEAIHIAPPMAGAREVIVVGTETVPDIDFARFSRDDPPQVFLEIESASGLGVRAGQPMILRLSATDDVGVVGVQLRVDGVPTPLDAQNSVPITPARAGVLSLQATVTDTSDQSAVRTWQVYVASPDGSLTFDPSLLGPGVGLDQGLNLRMISPVAGAVVAVDTPILATADSAAPLEWSLSFAAVDAIDPYRMADDDPDYVTLGTGTSTLYNVSVGVFPAASLADGVYFLRVRARPSGGGPTVFAGQVIAKGVDEATLRPVITIDDPPPGATITLTRKILGSVQSQRPVREWYAEIAPAAGVDVNDLGNGSTPWVRIASGNSPVADGELAVFDATRVPNGSYVLRVVAWNDLGLGRVEAVPLEVTGEAKFGRVRREFTDVRVDLAGFPLEVRRIYDSFAADRSGAFGYGWDLALRSADIGETVPDTGANLFGATPFKTGTRVYLTTPEGKRVGFTFRPELAASSFLGPIYRAVFDPDPGVMERLSTPEGDAPMLTVDVGGHARLFLLGLSWNPDRYVLSTPDQKRYTYHEDAGLLEAEDSNGQKLVVTTDSIEHSSGLAVLFERDASGRITRVTDPADRRWTYAYDTEGNLSQVTDPDGLITRHTYREPASHILEKVIDPLGRAGTTYEYDADGRMVATIDDQGNRLEQLWDPAGFSGTSTDRRGHVTQLVYNERGNVVRRQDPLGAVTLTEYKDPANPDRPTDETNPLGHTTKYFYDEHGNLTNRRPPIFFREEFAASYDSANRLLSRSMYRGLTSTFSYDPMGNILEHDVLMNPRATFAYSSAGQLVQRTTEAGFDTWWSHAPDTGQPNRVWDENGFDYQMTYNRAGDLASATGPRGETHQFTFDASGVPLTQTDPLGRTRTVARQPDGDLLATDRIGGQTRYRLASDGRLDRITYPDGGVLVPRYDADRHLASLTDPGGNRFDFTHDAMGRLTEVADAAGAVERARYDAAGQLIEFISRRGKRRTFQYDANGRRTAERWHGVEGDVIREIQFTWTQGRLTAITDGSASWSISGILPRPFSWRVTYPGQTTFQIGYNWLDRLTRTHGPTLVTVGVADQPPVAEVGAEYHGTQAQFYWWKHPQGIAGHMQIRRQADGLITNLRRFASQRPTVGGAAFSTTEMEWDMLGKIHSLRHLGPSGGLIHPHAAMTFTRDAESRIRRIEHPGNAADYTYDVAGQLITATHSAYPPESYGYDASGNRILSHTFTGMAAVDPGNRLRTAGPWAFAHDASGNVTRRDHTVTGASTEFEYDHRDRLHRAVVRPSPAAEPTSIYEFEYDFLDRMISRSLNGERTWILHDRSQPVAEFRDGSASLSATYFYAIDTAADTFGMWKEDDGAHWFLKDQVASVRGDLDAQGELRGWVDYDAFGHPQNSVPAAYGPLRHASRRWLPELGVYENGRRFVDPLTGRFLQEDPLRFRGGDFNLFRYVANNPLSYNDPTGTVAATEYATLVLAISRPSTFCSFATCVADLWEGVTNAVVNRQPAQPDPSNCGLKLLPAGGLIEDYINHVQGKNTLPTGSMVMAVDLGAELLDRGPGAGLAGPTWEMVKLGKCLYDAQ